MSPAAADSQTPPAGAGAQQPGLTHVCISVATAGRPRMFRDCLDGFAAMQVPDGVQLRFVFVENAAELTIAPLVAEWARSWPAPHQAECLLQPERGIPFARNTALARAQDLGCDWLIFVDDDEVVDPGWLVALLRGAQAQGFDLAAGPVEQLRPDAPLSPAQEAVFAYFAQEGRRRQAVRAADLQAGRAARNDLATNNWIARLAALRAHDLRFDEGMRFTGGTDTDLSRRARAAGLRIGWVPDAVVREVIPPARLTAAYVFDRACSQTLAKYHLRYTKAGRRPLAKPLLSALSKGLLGGVRLGWGALFSRQMALRGMRSLGVAKGWLMALRGARSQLYTRSQGY